MHEWLLWVEGAALPTWIRESGSVWAYPTVLTAHTLGMGVLVGASAVLDLRLLGVAPQIPLGPMVSVFRAIWFGATMSAATGLLLFSADATTKGTTTVFFVKLACIAAALVVVWMQRRCVFDRGSRPGRESALAQALALMSLGLWTAAITAGRLMAYLTPAPS